MSSVLDYLAGFYDQDPVGRPHGREAMGHDDARTTCEQPADFVEYGFFGGRVKRGGWLVENPQAGVPEYQAGESKPLELTAGKVLGAGGEVAERGFGSVGEGSDELRGLCRLKGVVNRLLGTLGVDPAERDVLAYGEVEDHEVLEEDSDEAADLLGL